ncbi:hypothetical protein BES08_29200 (plasmid) [Novosphingobium resinovorum]|uniref:RNA polymerase sigma factor 70 region 4 type 2 domain-containing protein n=2 Tax=Sphingomonadaceae TaxID=41297 RepID=A0A1D8AFI6_9SPHN|nr:hypothetical protein BES08_29200 [Novosphingobium resinovorum]
MQEYLEATLPPGEALLAAASDRNGGRPRTFRIDDQDPQARRVAAGFEVKAWVHVPADLYTPATWPGPNLARTLPAMPPMTAAILALRLHHDMPSAQIASRFGLGRREIRRHLLAAVRIANSPVCGALPIGEVS